MDFDECLNSCLVHLESFVVCTHLGHMQDSTYTSVHTHTHTVGVPQRMLCAEPFSEGREPFSK